MRLQGAKSGAPREGSTISPRNGTADGGCELGLCILFALPVLGRSIAAGADRRIRLDHAGQRYPKRSARSSARLRGIPSDRLVHGDIHLRRCWATRFDRDSALSIEGVLLGCGERFKLNEPSGSESSNTMLTDSSIRAPTPNRTKPRCRVVKIDASTGNAA